MSEPVPYRRPYKMEKRDERGDRIEKSSYLHPYIKNMDDLIAWGITKLGGEYDGDEGGLQNVELSKRMIQVCVADAIEKYTKYASFDIEDIIVPLDGYVHNRGLDLSEYNIADIHDIAFQRDTLLYGFGNDLFFGTGAMLQSYAGAGVFPFFNNVGTTNGSWIGLHNLHEHLEMINRLTGSCPQYRYFKSSKILKITPEPRIKPGYDNSILITCEVEPPPEELYGNEYVKRLFLALLKIQLGIVRKKFGSVQLPGGGTIDTEIGAEGKEEFDKAMEELRSSESFGNLCFCG